MHRLSDLPYSHDTLQPHLSEMTLQTHHLKHHQGYVNKLNALLEPYPELQKLSIKKLLTQLDTLDESIALKVAQSAGQVFNHDLYWDSLTPGGSKPTEDFITACERHFESFEELIAQLVANASTVFGSGWAWISLDIDNKIIVEATQNHHNPLMQGRTPLATIDVWEHAYYIDFKNERGTYIKNIIEIFDWAAISHRYQETINQ